MNTIGSEEKLIISIFLAVALLMIPAGVALAETSQAVTVTATPSYVSISNSSASWPIGAVAESSSYWSMNSTPTFPLDDGECYYTVTNDGSVAVDITVTGANFTGGVGWTIAGSTGENTVVVKAGQSGDSLEGNMVTLTTSPQAFISGLAASGTKKWELKLDTGTFTDGVEKSADITLSAAAS